MCLCVLTDKCCAVAGFRWHRRQQGTQDSRWLGILLEMSGQCQFCFWFSFFLPLFVSCSVYHCIDPATKSTKSEPQNFWAELLFYLSQSRKIFYWRFLAVCQWKNFKTCSVFSSKDMGNFCGMLFRLTYSVVVVIVVHSTRSACAVSGGSMTSVNIYLTITSTTCWCRPAAQTLSCASGKAAFNFFPLTQRSVLSEDSYSLGLQKLSIN